MRKMSVAVFALLAVSCLLMLTPARAQEATDEDKFSFGKIVSVAADQITVREYDFTKDADVETTYSLTPETELGNINAVTDLVAGDDVVLDYAEKDGKRTVTTLVKEEKGGETLPAAEGEAAAPAVTEGTTAPQAVAPAAPAVDAAAIDAAAEGQPAAEVAPATEAAPAEAPAQQ